MFTIEQVRAAHSQVKSGADFPAYVRDMKQLGVVSYDHYTGDGHITYFGLDGFVLNAPAKWEAVAVAETANAGELKHALAIHQQGQTDYLTFCMQSAAAGSEKWTVDMPAMTCAYYDKAGHVMVIEHIPAV